MTDQTGVPAKPAFTSTELADQRTDLAVMRTVMASDRTLMAWIRTALSMISFGFTIYKFLQYIRESEGAGLRVNGPRNLGMALIFLGTLSLFAAGIQHFRLLKKLKAEHEVVRAWSMSLTIAFAITLLGVLAFLNVSLRLGPF